MAFGFGFSFPHALGGGFTPASLFTAGEQGAWYQPDDFSTLFQDSAGTTPVTAVEQAVGLMLDKSKGLVLGSELGVVTNGFNNDTATGWITVANVSARTATSFTTSGIGGVQLGTGGNIVQNGKRYRIEISWTKSDASTAFSVRPIPGVDAVTSTAASGSFIFYERVEATGTVYLRLAAAATVTISNISVRELPGNHAYQTTSTSRPTLRARYNLLTYSEQFDNAAWTKTSATVTANTATAPDGTTTADKLVENTAAAEHFALVTNITVTANAVCISSVYVKAAERTSVHVRAFSNGSPVAQAFFNTLTQTFTQITGGTWAFESIGSDWYRVQVTATHPTAAGNGIGVFLVSGTNTLSYTGDGTSGIYIWGADLRVANDGVGIPAYQRIAAATDYDTAGFPPYLAFDGSDDSLLTNSIDFSGTDKMTVFAGVRKINTRGTIAEISANANLNNGAFYLGPGSSVDSDALGYTYWTRGTVTQFANSPANYPVPDSAVLAATSSISGDSAILRANGAQAASSTADQGTGNYGNYPLYIGRRNNATLPFNGRLYSLIVRGATTSDAQIASTEAWVNGRTKAY